MMLKRLQDCDTNIVQIKTYKKLFYSCVYLPEYFQKLSFEYTRNHLKVLENVKHFNTDNDNFYRHHRCEYLNDGYHTADDSIFTLYYKKLQLNRIVRIFTNINNFFM